MYYQTSSQKPASEGVFDRMEMSDQILKNKGVGGFTLMFAVQVFR